MWWTVQIHRRHGIVLYGCIRLITALLLGGVLAWILVYLSGFGFRPVNGNTSKIFNWHILLNVLAFSVFMTEALLSDSYHITRPRRNQAQHVFQGCAAVCVVAAVVSAFLAFRFHANDGVPQPLPNLKSVHSWAGVVTFSLFATQLLLGWFVSTPGGSLRSAKRYLLCVYEYLKPATYLIALATTAAGLTEKTEHIMAGSSPPPGPTAGIVLLPKVAVVLLILLGISVSYLSIYQTRDQPKVSKPEHEPLLKDDLEDAP